MWYMGFDVNLEDLLNPASAGLMSTKSGAAGGPCVVHSGKPSHWMTMSSSDHGLVALDCTSGSVLKMSGGVASTGGVDSGGELHGMPSDTGSGVRGIPVLGPGLTTSTSSVAAAPPCVMLAPSHTSECSVMSMAAKPLMISSIPSRCATDWSSPLSTVGAGVGLVTDFES